jgi:L-threonylcarbamoyladenylate synthase
VKEALRIYYSGGVFIYPTDTIYGFGANPFNSDAVERISFMKQRDETKRFILLVDSIDTLLRYVDFREEYHVDFLLAIWPNPVSVVLPLKQEHARILQMDTAAFRIPHHHFCAEVLRALGALLISTSVNRAGDKPLIEYHQFHQEFSTEVDAIFYTPRIPMNVSSTVIALAHKEVELIREGKYPFNHLIETYINVKRKFLRMDQ